MTGPADSGGEAGIEADVKEAHKLIVEKLGHAEVLIYNAGMGSFANIGR